MSLLLIFIIGNVGKKYLIPKFIRAKPGDTVKFRCISDGNVTWYFQHGEMPPNTCYEKIGSTRHSVKLSNAQQDHTGQYSCVGTYQGNSHIAYGYLSVSPGTKHLISASRLHVDYNSTMTYINYDFVLTFPHTLIK